MKAIGYFRQPAGNGKASISKQNRGFLDYCESEGYEVAATFSEEPSEEAPAFAQLMEYLKKPEKGFVIIVVQSPAALADDVGAAAARCLQIERLGGKVHFLGSESDPLADILQTWPRPGAEDVGDRVRTAMRRKAVRGEVLGRPPYGYKAGARNRLEVVEEESVVVRYIFRLYLRDGLGIRLIARRLNEEGNLTRRNRPWSMVSIRDILKNRAYLGTYQRLGVRVPGSHPALVSPEDFRRVQDRLNDRRTNFSPRTVSQFVLSGIAVCEHCGNRMIGVSRRQSWKRQSDGSAQQASYRYYQCESRTNQGICSYHTHRAEELEDEVRRQLAEVSPRQLATPGDDAAVIEEWQEEARRLRDRLKQIDRRIGQALQAAAGEPMSREKFRVRGLALAEERLAAEEELRNAEWRADNYSSAAERRRGRQQAIEKLTEGWESLTIEERRELLREVVDRVVVSDEDAKLVLKP